MRKVVLTSTCDQCGYEMETVFEPAISPVEFHLPHGWLELRGSEIATELFCSPFCLDEWVAEMRAQMKDFPNWYRRS